MKSSFSLLVTRFVWLTFKTRNDAHKVEFFVRNLMLTFCICMSRLNATILVSVQPVITGAVTQTVSDWLISSTFILKQLSGDSGGQRVITPPPWQWVPVDFYQQSHFTIVLQIKAHQSRQVGWNLFVSGCALTRSSLTTCLSVCRDISTIIWHKMWNTEKNGALKD